MRTRQFKPGLFKNAVLAELDGAIYPTKVFLALISMADREGRLKYDIPRICGESFAYYMALDAPGTLKRVQECVEMLQKCGKNVFIRVYYVGREKYIQIVNFTKHQHVHIHEPASVIPPERHRARHRAKTGSDTVRRPSASTSISQSTISLINRPGAGQNLDKNNLELNNPPSQDPENAIDEKLDRLANSFAGNPDDPEYRRKCQFISLLRGPLKTRLIRGKMKTIQMRDSVIQFFYQESARINDALLEDYIKFMDGSGDDKLSETWTGKRIMFERSKGIIPNHLNSAD